MKLDAAGAELGYATFLGGSAWDYGQGIAVDASRQAYVTGRTDSPDFPTNRRHSYDATQNGGFDAFVVELDAAGAALRYATFLGGSDYDQGYDIAADNTGQVYVTGDTGSADFPAGRGPGYDTSFNGGHADAFAVKLDMTATTQSVWLPLSMR